MTTVTFDRVCEFLRSVFQLLWSKPDGLPAREVIAFLPEIMELTAYEREAIALSHMPRYEKIVRLATIPLVKAGWLNKSNRGLWSITDEGREASRKYANARELFKDAVRLLDERDQNKQTIFLAIEEAEELAWEQVQRYLMEMKQAEFRQLVRELLQAMGYHLAWVAPPDKHRGQIDMIAKVDPLGAKGSQILVQVKHKGQVITLEGLRSFLSVLGSGHYGLIISSGGFSKGIREESLMDEYRRITLWDLEDIFELWVRYYTKLDQNAQTRLPLSAVYFLNGVR